MSTQLRKRGGWIGVGLLLAWVQVSAADAPKADAAAGSASASATATAEAPKPESPKVGSPFPALDTFSLEGKLPDTKGKVVIVDFWASWCSPCLKALPSFAELHEKYAAQGLVVIAVNVDEDKAAMDGFLKKTPLPFAIVRDAEEKLQKRMDLDGLPVTYIVDRQGVIQVIHDGFVGDETKKEYAAKIEALLK